MVYWIIHNGLLPYKNHFGFWDEFIDLKPYVVVSNNYNIEFGNDITESRRYFDLNFKFYFLLLS